jgi:non-specific serine/threonine protein kinase
LAAEAVCRGEEVPAEGVLEVIAQLVNKSLVSVTNDELKARYRLLEPVRQYAEERLAGSNDEHVAHEQHVSWFLAFSERPTGAARSRPG